MDNPRDTKQLNFITIGKIIASFGKSGQVKIIPMTDFPERFFSSENLFIFPENSQTPIKIKLSNQFKHKNLIIANISGCAEPDEAKKYINKEIKIKKEQLRKLEKNSYYIFDIIGMKVQDEVGNYIGQIENIIANPSNDIYIITTTEGKEFLVPAIGRYIKKVDIKNKIMIIIKPEYENAD